MSLLRVSLLAGTSAALASAVGKVAFDGARSWGARAVGVLMLLALNAMLFRFTALGMDKASAAVQVTALVSAANFVLSGFLGWSMFGESLSIQWCAGAALMVIGVWLLSSEEVVEKK